MKILRMIILLIGSLVMVSQVFAQEPIQVETNFSDNRWLNRNQTLILKFSRALQPDEGNIAIFAGAVDMTSLFVRQGNALTYIPNILLLPSGITEMVVYLVSKQNQWQEIARLPFRVRTGLGLEKSNIASQVSVNNASQIAEGHNPDTNAPPRETFSDFTGQANLSSEHGRGTLMFSTNWDLVGASEQNQALRFFEKAEDAAQIDLSSFMVNLKAGETALSVGHVSHGRQRHLINFFGSRGVMLQSKINQRLDFSAAAMNGTSIVGWNNFLGLNNKRHRIYSGTVGVDVLKRPGGLRLEGSAMDASLLPLDNFNQGSITDTEESQGFGFRLAASDRSQRLRLETGFARSKFNNPQDQLLAQGDDLVEVQATTKNARYADLNIGILQNLSLGQNWQTNLNVNVRHERVDPLYRSLTAFARADYMENAVDVQGNIGLINLQYSHNQSEDNLDEIESILKTKTRVNSVSLGVPLNSIFNPVQGPKTWLPSVSYNYNRVHQFGEGLPVNSGFSEGHVPDQFSYSHNAGLDWQSMKWRFGYRLSYNSQDNRQVGRENNDFKNLNNAFNFGLNPLQFFDVNFELAFENAENKAADSSDLTRRYGVGFNLRIRSSSSLNFTYSTTHSENDLKTSEQNNSFLNAQWSTNFRLKRSLEKNWLQGQWFIRFVRSDSDSKDTTFGFENAFDNWTVNTGFNISLF